MAAFNEEDDNETLPEEVEQTPEASEDSRDRLADAIVIIAGAADIAVNAAIKNQAGEERVVRRVPRTPSAQEHKEAVLKLVEWFESRG